MLTSEAQVQTDRSSRYLVQLCRHVNQLGGHSGHRPGSHNGNATHVPPEVRHVEWSDTEGVVSLSWGQWTMRAAPGALILRVEAADPANLRRIQDLVAARLQKIGRRDNLTVTWQPTQGHEGQPGDVTDAGNAAPPEAMARRKRRSTIGLAVLAGLAIALHLGLGGAALAGSRWTSLTTNIVLALVAVKVIAVAVVALRRRGGHRTRTGARFNTRSPHTRLHRLRQPAASADESH